MVKGNVRVWARHRREQEPGLAWEPRANRSAASPHLAQRELVLARESAQEP
jgi:hypothetical protein